MDDGRHLRLGQPEVDEPGPRDLGARDHFAREGELFDDRFGHLAWRPSEGFGELEREVRGEVAVALVARPLEHELRVRRSQLGGRPVQCLAERLGASDQDSSPDCLGAGLSLSFLVDSLAGSFSLPDFSAAGFGSFSPSLLLSFSPARL